MTRRLRPALVSAAPDRLRVAIVAPPWLPVPPPSYGGTESVLDNLARGLAAAGHEVMLFATGDSTCPVPSQWVLQQAAGTAVAGSGIELRHVVHAYRAIADWGADVVHDHTLCGPVYSRGLSSPGAPVVTTNHGPFTSPVLADIYRDIAPQVPIIAISHHHASSAGDIPVAAVIHHGVDVETYPAGDGRGGYALFLGRMCPDKGVDAAITLARRAGVPLRIAAKMREPAEIAYFDERVRPLLGGAVEYLGEVGADQKRELLADAVCLLNPIAWPEPFGMVMIEALAAGTPVVATPRGSVPEIVREGVTGFVRDTPHGLVQALTDVGELDRGACRRDAVRRFSSLRMVDDHVRLFRSLTRSLVSDVPTIETVHVQAHDASRMAEQVASTLINPTVAPTTSS